MAPTFATKWQLYVDESGRFSDPGDDVVVAGVLTPDMDAAQPAKLARRLADAAPLPWPLHAAYLHRPAWWLLSLLNPAAGLDRTYPEIYRRAADVLIRSGGEQLLSTLESVRSGVSVDETLIPIDRMMRHSDRDLYRAIEDQIAQAQQAIWQVVGSVFAANGNVVLCTEMWRGAAYDVALDERQRETARYNQLLKGVFERLSGALRALGGTHEVRVQVLTRPVVDRVLAHKVALHFRHVSSILREALPPDDRFVHIVVDDVPEFNDRAHPALVVADFVANRVRGVTASSAHLAEVERAIRETTHLGTRLGAGQPTLLAVAGSLGTGEPAPWAVEQSTEWEARAR